MKQALSLSVLFIVMCFMLAGTDAVRCFQCTSLGGESCGDPFQLTFEDTAHMANGCTYCTKKETKDAVARTCEIDSDYKEGCSSTVSLKTCICAGEDLCNAAHQTTAHYIAAMLLGLALLIL